MAYLAGRDSPDPVMIGEIADAYNIPKQFLAKITQVLVKHRLLSAHRGRKGGVMLAKPPVDISLPQIIEAVDGPAPEERFCIFGLDVCSNEHPCPLHDHWKAVRGEIRLMLESENLECFARDLMESGKGRTGTPISFP